MFEFIYYGFVVWFLLIEIGWVLDVSEKVERTNKIKELAKNNKDKKWADMDNEYKTLVKSVFTEPIVMIIVVLGGLFTFQWPIWAFLLVLSIIVMSPISKFARKQKIYSITYIVAWINSVLGFAIALFVLINKYHLHYNLVEIVQNFFQ